MFLNKVKITFNLIQILFHYLKKINFFLYFLFSLISFYSLAESPFQKGNFIFSMDIGYSNKSQSITRPVDKNFVTYYTTQRFLIPEKSIDFNYTNHYNTSVVLFTPTFGYFIIKNLAIGVKFPFQYITIETKVTNDFDEELMKQKYPTFSHFSYDILDPYVNLQRFNLASSIWVRYFVSLQKIKSAFSFEFQIDNSKNDISNLINRMGLGFTYSYFLSSKTSIDVKIHHFTYFKNEFYNYRNNNFQLSLGISYFFNFKKRDKF